MGKFDPASEPAALLVEFLDLVAAAGRRGPVLDLACGACQNGILVAAKGPEVVCCDRSPEALEAARKLADAQQARVAFQQTDLERGGVNPLPELHYGAILVFRYLHRPLIPCIRKALLPEGVLIYETFTRAQVRIDRPHNPDFLLKPGELLDWFQDWEIHHHFEGILEGPRRAVAQLVCRKPL